LHFTACATCLKCWWRGRERQYLQAFFQPRFFDPSAVDDAELDLYASACSAPGAMRAGFELYRAFDRDSEDNRATFKRAGKLTIPVLAVGGAVSTTGPLMGEMMREVAENVGEFRVPRTGHWIVEENPDALMERLWPFLKI
jgi:pimeloyl-ACP methyl ester carboxylesterase